MDVNKDDLPAGTLPMLVAEERPPLAAPSAPNTRDATPSMRAKSTSRRSAPPADAVNEPLLSERVFDSEKDDLSFL